MKKRKNSCSDKIFFVIPVMAQVHDTLFKSLRYWKIHIKTILFRHHPCVISDKIAMNKFERMKNKITALRTCCSTGKISEAIDSHRAEYSGFPTSFTDMASSYRAMSQRLKTYDINIFQVWAHFDRHGDCYSASQTTNFEKSWLIVCYVCKPKNHRLDNVQFTYVLGE